MAFKSIVTAGMLALSMAFVPTAADAKTRVVIGIGNGWVGPGWYGDSCWGRHRRHCGPYIGHHVYPPYYYYNRPVVYYNDPLYYRDYEPVYRRVSCGAAKNALADRGYRRIVARDCSGKVYSFRASKNGRSYVVQVSARTARIIGVSRI